MRQSDVKTVGSYLNVFGVASLMIFSINSFSDTRTESAHAGLTAGDSDPDVTLNENKVYMEEPGLFLFFDKQQQVDINRLSIDRQLLKRLQNEMSTDDLGGKSTMYSSDPDALPEGLPEEILMERRDNPMRYDGVVMRGTSVIGVWINGQRTTQKFEDNNIVTAIGDGTVKPNGSMLISSSNGTYVLSAGQSTPVESNGVIPVGAETQQRKGAQ